MGRALINLVVKKGGFQDSDGHWNSIRQFENDNKIYRERVETLVFKDNNMVFLKKLGNNMYKIPGGSIERDIPDFKQAMNECREEALIKVSDPIYTGIDYKIVTGVPKWVIEKNLMITWNANYNHVYIAKFKSWFKGFVDEIDRDPVMASGEFYLIDDVYDMLRDEHKQAVNKFREISEK